MSDEGDEADVPTPRMVSWARNSAIYRLERRMLTERQLSQAIARKAKEKFENISVSQVQALADLAVKFGYDIKALDDVAYAQTSTRSGMRSGKSKRTISYNLVQKGVAKETVAASVDVVDDLVAAVTLARKRAFGPFRKVDLDEKRKAKEVSAFARAGFGFDIAMRVFSMSPDEAQEVLDNRSDL